MEVLALGEQTCARAARVVNRSRGTLRASLDPAGTHPFASEEKPSILDNIT